MAGGTGVPQFRTMEQKPGDTAYNPATQGGMIPQGVVPRLMPLSSGGQQANLMGANGQVGGAGTRIPQQNPNLFDNSSRPSSMNNLGAGKGGGGQPAMPSNLAGQPPQQGQYAPMAPQGQFNVNQASAGALEQALGTTQQAMQGPINIGAYANPFTGAVIDRTQQDIARQQEMASNQIGAQATAAKAFGGSRQGVAEGVMAGEYGRMSGDIAAQQRQANYSQALQAAMADRQSRLGAASQLGNLGQQAFQTGQTIQGNQQQQGLLQQSIQQALIDAARQQYAGYTGAPTQALQAPLAALGIAQQGGASTTTESDRPGLLSYLQAASSFMPK